MNKPELVSAMALKSELSKKDSEAALKAFEEVVMETLAKGEEIKMVGFGTFSVADRNPREGEITLADGTKKPWKTEAKKAPKFKPSKPMKDLFK